MPYNNTPIVPPAEWTGSVSLPLARVKKIISNDADIGACSNNAAFTIAVATEMFVQHLVEQSHNSVKAEKRQRRNLQYKDVANAVSRIDNLEFLADVVPRTMTYKAYKDKKAAKEKEARGEQQQTVAHGQRTLEQMSKHQKQHEREDTEMTEDIDDEEEHDGNGASNGHDYEGDTSSSPEAKPLGRHKYDAVRDEIHERSSMED